MRCCDWYFNVVKSRIMFKDELVGEHDLLEAPWPVRGPNGYDAEQVEIAWRTMIFPAVYFSNWVLSATMEWWWHEVLTAVSSDMAQWGFVIALRYNNMQRQRGLAFLRNGSLDFIHSNPVVEIVLTLLISWLSSFDAHLSLWLVLTVNPRRRI